MMERKYSTVRTPRSLLLLSIRYALENTIAVPATVVSSAILMVFHST